MTASDPIVIVGAARTPMGGFQGELAGLAAPALGAAAIKAAVERSGLSPDQVEEVFMGCVLPAGVGQAPARQARSCRNPTAILGSASCGRGAGRSRA